MYWKRPGKGNTEKTIELARKRAKELELRYMVVASNTGETAIEALTSGLKIICVTHHVGFKEPGYDELPEEMRKRLRKKGISILTTTHLLAGVDRALRNKHQGIYPAEMIAESLRMLGQGVKVTVEISVMALDAGRIPFGEKVIAIGGTGQGADTAVLITPQHSSDIFKTKIHEILCKPGSF